MLIQPLMRNILTDPIQKIAQLVIFLCVILCIIELYSLYNFLHSNSLKNSSASVIISPDESEQQPLTSGFPLPNGHGPDSSRSSHLSDAVLNAPLFGNYIPIKSSDTDTIQQSMLGYEVVGILYSQKKKYSQVIMRSKNGVTKTYVIGDNLLNGVIIKAITGTDVIFSHNGILERLRLPIIPLVFKPLSK